MLTLMLLRLRRHDDACRCYACRHAAAVMPLHAITLLIAKMPCRATPLRRCRLPSCHYADSADAVLFFHAFSLLRRCAAEYGYASSLYDAAYNRHHIIDTTLRRATLRAAMRKRRERRCLLLLRRYECHERCAMMPSSRSRRCLMLRRRCGDDSA